MSSATVSRSSFHSRHRCLSSWPVFPERKVANPRRPRQLNNVSWHSLRSRLLFSIQPVFFFGEWRRWRLLRQYRHVQLAWQNNMEAAPLPRPLFLRELIGYQFGRGSLYVLPGRNLGPWPLWWVAQEVLWYMYGVRTNKGNNLVPTWNRFGSGFDNVFVARPRFRVRRRHLGQWGAVRLCAQKILRTYMSYVVVARPIVHRRKYQ